jgi:hypothetical protein
MGMNNRRKTLAKSVYWSHHGKRHGFGRMLAALFTNKYYVRKRPPRFYAMSSSVRDLMGKR